VWAKIGFGSMNESWHEPDAFGFGRFITSKAIDFAIADKRILYVTYLLPPSRRNLGAFERLGALAVGEIEYDGATFLKYHLETESPLLPA
jgi:hypothetical protein